VRINIAKTITLTKADLKDAITAWIYSKHVADSEYGSIVRMNDLEIDPDDEESYLMVSGDFVEYDSKDPK
jgi:hypothetical protein